MTYERWSTLRDEKARVSSFFGRKKRSMSPSTSSSQAGTINTRLTGTFAVGVSSPIAVQKVFKPKEMPVETNGRWEEKYPRKDFEIVQSSVLMLHTMMCCGVKEIHGIQQQVIFLNKTGPRKYKHEYEHPADLIAKIQPLYGGFKNFRPFMIFSDNSQSVGESLAKYIKDNKLGSIHRSTEERNDNSGNKITVYLWTVSRDFLKHKPN